MEHFQQVKAYEMKKIIKYCKPGVNVQQNMAILLFKNVVCHGLLELYNKRVKLHININIADVRKM